MNTYLNEIISESHSISDNGSDCKIPSGAWCGNGDLGVVFDTTDKDLVIHISKCDFWKFARGAHNDGGIKSVGDLKISNLDLSRYNIKQYYDRGMLEFKCGNTEIEFFVGCSNIICFEIKSKEAKEKTCVNINIPDTCNSENGSFIENEVKCFTRKFSGEALDRETVAVVCLKEISTTVRDGFRVARYCISVVTNFDYDNYTGKGVAMVLDCDYEKAKAETQKKWTEFFSASKVTLEDKEIEKFYNSSLYLLAG
ncbi:MAG: hypothetical protein IKC01_07030, partial [Clostridia bacterium]|nr:hypothetical protein [Clostridia bacterium]